MWFDASIEVIPAVDVLGEEAVRLHRGAYDAVVERADDPVALAARWAGEGASRIHLVDLDGARAGRVRPGARRRGRRGRGRAGAGVRRDPRRSRTRRRCSTRAPTASSSAPPRGPIPAPWLELGDAVVLALDVRDGRGARRRAGPSAPGISFAEALERAGRARVLVTAIDRDGTLAGPDLELVRKAAARRPARARRRRRPLARGRRGARRGGRRGRDRRPGATRRRRRAGGRRDSPRRAAR